MGRILAPPLIGLNNSHSYDDAAIMTQRSMEVLTRRWNGAVNYDIQLAVYHVTWKIPIGRHEKLPVSFSHCGQG